MERRWARPRDDEAGDEREETCSHTDSPVDDYHHRGGERRRIEEAAAAGRRDGSSSKGKERRRARSRSRSSSRGSRSSSSSSSASSSSSSSSTSSSHSGSSSSSSDGRRRRSKRKSKSKSKSKSKKKSKSKREKRDKKKSKSRKSKDRRHSSSRKHDRKDAKDRKGRKDRKDEHGESQASKNKHAGRSPERLFYERAKYLSAAAAATRLQRALRGHIVRRWSTPTIRRIRAQRKALSLELFDVVLREVVEGELIPDMLIEIITSMDPSSFAPHPQWMQEQIKLSEAILCEVTLPIPCVLLFPTTHVDCAQLSCTRPRTVTNGAK